MAMNESLRNLEKKKRTNINVKTFLIIYISVISLYLICFYVILKMKWYFILIANKYIITILLWTSQHYLSC